MAIPATPTIPDNTTPLAQRLALAGEGAARHDGWTPARMAAFVSSPHVAEFLDEVVHSDEHDVDIQEVIVAPGSPADGAEIEVGGVVKALDADTGRATVEMTVTAEGAKVLGRCVAVVQLD